MKNIRNKDLSDRRNAASEAKMLLLQAYRSAADAAAPTRAARQAKRLAIVEAREARHSERKQAKEAEQNRVAAEAAEREAADAAAARADAEARALAESNRISRVIEDEAARKAQRDRKYAARKARRA